MLEASTDFLYNIHNLIKMFKNPNIIWLNTNPYLRRFNLPVIQHLSNYVDIGHWEYQQTEDEGTSFAQGINLLEDYLSTIKKPMHLVGHSTCGLLGLYYAYKYPQRVKSLTLLGVGVNPAIDWLSYYYLWRKDWDCSQEVVLAHLAKYLFGSQSHYYRKAFVAILEKAMFYSLSKHSLYKQYSYFHLPKIECPLMIIGSVEDQIVPWSEIAKWKTKLKSTDMLWQCPTGEHFFHYFQPQLIGEKLLEFWSQKEQLILAVN